MRQVHLIKAANPEDLVERVNLFFKSIPDSVDFDTTYTKDKEYIAFVEYESRHPPTAQPTEAGTGRNPSDAAVEPLPLATVERNHIEHVLGYACDNKGRAARILGITAATLYNKLKLYRARDNAQPDASSPQMSE